MLYRREGFPNEDELVLSTVTKVMNHAVFVNLDEYDKGGLIHISEVAPGRIRNIREYVELGKKIVCKVLRVNNEKGHIDLSLRRVSEIERKKKLEEIKQEQKAEKVIEMAAQQLNLKPQQIYDTVTGKVFERYPFLYLFFKEVSENKIELKELISDNNLVEALDKLVKERFKPAKMIIKGTLFIKSYADNGIEIIKKTLLDFLKKKTATGISYIGGGKYKVNIEAETYKDAEWMLAQLLAATEKAILPSGETSFTR